MHFFKITFISFILIFSSILSADTGKDIFDRYCTACHSQAMSPLFNSPAVHDLDAWTKRKNDAFDRILEQDSSIKNLSESEKNEASINELVMSAVRGTDKGMPPMGTCAECTHDELKSVINFMSSAE